jgi:hypothetical protein
MHWAAHGQTAAEVIVTRAYATQPNLGLTTYGGDLPRKTDVSIARKKSSKKTLKERTDD